MKARVEDARRPPFAWIGRDALECVRRELPESRQPGARNVLLALSEAASARRDGQHRNGDRLSDLVMLSGLSKNSVRDYLGELERLGLVSRHETVADSGAQGPTFYRLEDGAPVAGDGGPTAGGYPPVENVSSGGSARARDNGGKDLKKKEGPPLPPKGERIRDRKGWEDELRAWGEEWFPGVPFGLVKFAVVEIRSLKEEPTLELVQRFVEKHRPTEDSAA